MQYYFIAGSNQGLSFAEVQTFFSSQFGSDNIELTTFGDTIVIDFKKTVPTDENMITWFERFGGIIKFGKVLHNQEVFLADFAEKKTEENGSIRFGVSMHGQIEEVDDPYGRIKDLSKKIKKYFKNKSVSSGYTLVKRRETALTSAQVYHNDLTDDGFELVLICTKEDGKLEIIPGVTLAVQNLEDFSFRDFKKPAIDVEMGMLPLKLARIMVNLASIEPGSIIWDPFCGSGTLLLEALHLGYDVLGSDVDTNAVENTRKNIEWMGSQYDLEYSNFRVFNFNIQKPDSKIVGELRHTPISAVICEPYMGPPQKSVIDTEKATKLAENYGTLIAHLFELIENLRQENLRVVIVVPSYKSESGWVNVSLNTLISPHWEIQNSNYDWDLQWSRKNSIIRRNIMVLELNR